ncbi:hypothetical protein H4V99_002983 [Cryobacterium sp. CG_9.6]|nr:hypothetical protein [Cryobacterium sp. CG_9.6]
MSGEPHNCRVTCAFLATTPIVLCGGSRAADSTSSHWSRPRFATDMRTGIRLLDTPNMSGNLLCGSCLSNTHPYTFTVVVMCSGPEAVRPIRKKGSRHIDVQASYTIFATTTQVQEPPGRAQNQGSWEGFALLYTYLSWVRAESQRLRIRRYERYTLPSTGDPRKSAGVQGNPQGILLFKTGTSRVLLLRARACPTTTAAAGRMSVLSSCRMGPGADATGEAGQRF